MIRNLEFRRTIPSHPFEPISMALDEALNLCLSTAEAVGLAFLFIFSKGNETKEGQDIRVGKEV